MRVIGFSEKKSITDCYSYCSMGLFSDASTFLFSKARWSTLPEQAFTLFFFLINLFYIAFYYLNSNFLIPKLLEQNKIIAYTAIIVGLLIFFGMFPGFYQYFFGEFLTIFLYDTNRPRNSVRRFSSGSRLQFFCWCSFSVPELK